MADIVERLDAAGCTAGCNSSPVCLCALCQDAAVEVRALRARVAELEAEKAALVERIVKAVKYEGCGYCKALGGSNGATVRRRPAA